MNIGLDFGGVIANHQSTKLAVAKQHGVSVATEADVVRAILVPKIGQDQYDAIVRETAAQTLQFPVTAGIETAFNLLTQAGHTLHIVSTQETITDTDLEQYLKKHNLHVNSIDVVHQDGGKLAMCQKRSIDVFLDDSVSVLQSLFPLHIPLHLAQFAAVYEIETPEGISIVRDWDAFVLAVQSLSS